ncbi:MAG: alpha/beta hydrolase [Desulfobacteraceae bacterium]|jgi:dienelactone hydrolase
MSRISLILALIAMIMIPGINSSTIAQETICLWEGKAPGSENWNYDEKISSFPGRGSIVQNVVDPTMTVYLPAPSIANGAAVIICPAGAFRMLSLDGAVAEWLNKQGFAAFILKYRLYNPGNSKMAPMDPSKIKLSLKYANANPAPDNHELNNVIRLATNDGQQAIRLVRRNAEKWHIDPNKIGIMGFSAGGGVAVGTALLDDPEGYPDFVVSLYGPSMVDVHVPQNAPPLFIAVAANHKPVSMGCVALYSVWNEAGKSTELHVFSKGRGGFGIEKQGLPSDAWSDLFLVWLKGEGFI